MVFRISFVVVAMLVGSVLLGGGNCERNKIRCNDVPQNANPRTSDSFKLNGSVDGTPVEKLECANGDRRIVITECQLLDVMSVKSWSGDKIKRHSSIYKKSYLKKTVKPHLEHLNLAMGAFDLNCGPRRAAAFLAQVRYETAQLNTKSQSLDLGAGGVHMIPHHWGKFINGVMYVRQQLIELMSTKSFRRSLGKTFSSPDDVTSELSSLPLDANKFTGKQRKLVKYLSKHLIEQPHIVFLSAGWWFARGSQLTMPGMKCGDLRLLADGGSEKFQRLTACIYGSEKLDGSLKFRRKHYDNILKVLGG